MYVVNVIHYAEGVTHAVQTFKRKKDAVTFCEQQLFIQRGYNRSCFMQNDQWIVLQPQSDVRESTFWIAKVK